MSIMDKLRSGAKTVFNASPVGQAYRGLTRGVKVGSEVLKSPTARSVVSGVASSVPGPVGSLARGAANIAKLNKLTKVPTQAASYGPSQTPTEGPTQTAQTSQVSSLGGTPMSSSPSSSSYADPAAEYLRRESEAIQSGGNSRAARAATTAASAASSPSSPSATTSPTATIQSQSQAPSTPTQSAGPSLVDQLRGKVSGLSTMSKEEQALSDQLAQFRGDAAMGVAGLEGQGRGIPLGIIRGQQGRLNTQNQLQEQTLLDRLTNASAQRQLALQAAQTELDYATQDQARQDAIAQASRERQDALTAPIEVNGSLLQYDPTTGSYKTLYSAPATVDTDRYASSGGVIYDKATGQIVSTLPDSGSSDGFSLSPGETRYDAFGNVIASSPKSSSSNMSATQQTALADMNSAIDSIGSALTSLESGAFQTGPISTLSQGLANVTGVGRNQDRVAFEANLANIKAQFMKALSGAAVSEQEVRRLSQFLPSITDQEATIKTKLNQLQAELDRQRSNLISATGGSVDSGSDDIDSFLDSFSQDLSTSQNGSLGSLSEKYESGGNPGAIGYDNTGGYSYGTYQLAHSNAKNFIEQSSFKDAFKGLTFNSPAWRQRWQQVAQQAPQAFAQAQKQFIEKTHFAPQLQKLASAGINPSSLSSVLKDVIWSTAVQHGPATDVIVKALQRVGSDASEAEKIKAIYAERWGGGSRFSRSTQNVKRAVYNRFFGPQGELRMALSRLGNNIG